MIHWNYRVVRRVFKAEIILGIHEAYYADDGDELPQRITSEPIAVIGDKLRHVGRLLRNGIERQEMQILIDRANSVQVFVPVPRYQARHHVINPPFRSSARPVKSASV